MKKSYNPFLLWGSYLGLVLGLIVLAILLFAKLGSGILSDVTGYELLFYAPFDSLENFLLLVGILGIPIYGFLLGYGIHSLIRKLRK